MEVSESEVTFQSRKCLVSLPVAAVVHHSLPGKETLDFHEESPLACLGSFLG